MIALDAGGPWPELTDEELAAVRALLATLSAIEANRREFERLNATARQQSQAVPDAWRKRVAVLKDGG